MAAAATEAPSAHLALTAGEKILVTVEYALPDILVVSFVHGAKCFQGALLDAAKRGLPCGVHPPEPVPDPDGDKLATIAARFSYFQERKNALSTSSTAVVAKVDLRKSINPPARYKNARPTVRLRPRQVLCSKCRSICNENSENVDVSRKRKHEEAQQQSQQLVPGSTRRSDRRCGQQSQKTQRTLSECQMENSTSNQATTKTTTSNGTDSSKLGASLIPKLSRLQPNEISNAMQSSGQLSDKVKVAASAQSTHWPVGNEEEASLRNVLTSSQERVESSADCDNNPSMAYCATPRRLSSSSVESAKVPEEEEKKTFAAADSTMRLRTGRIPRKKRSVGSMEDLWDESVFEDPTRTARTTPVIKISFGAQGEGTVLKIPAKPQDPDAYEQEIDDADDIQQERDPLDLPRSFDNDYEGEEDGQEQVDPQKQGDVVKDASAKAAKRALKKAKKEARRKMLGGVSPARSPCNGSPRYNPTYDPLSYHRRKHKVKHKKKHKEGRKHKNQSQDQPETEQPCPDSAEQEQEQQHQQNWNVLPGSGESYRAIKEQCLKQKLSISLKRLNTNAYARCDYPVSNASSGCKSSGGSSDELSENEPEVETAPDFPPHQSHPLVMRLAATPVTHCTTADGRRMDVGDVVWGKILGFPWWPGKVLSITESSKEDGTSSGPQAHVAWYGSSTSSLMSCDQLSPFLETFKTRYKKKKRGAYKEAIRQAQNEARSQITPNSTSSVLNVCGSPREVNVLS
ncbi:uncharacterized protein [Anoplolepis gracilipes]|uniref:uncharacterized protein n=1 Tax=Anoplolepis gracilipes TaxID=354296 RepID=UPI003BA0E952